MKKTHVNNSQLDFELKYGSNIKYMFKRIQDSTVYAKKSILE